MTSFTKKNWTTLNYIVRTMAASINVLFYDKGGAKKMMTSIHERPPSVIKKPKKILYWNRGLYTRKLFLRFDFHFHETSFFRVSVSGPASTDSTVQVQDYVDHVLLLSGSDCYYINNSVGYPREKFWQLNWDVFKRGKEMNSHIHQVSESRLSITWLINIEYFSYFDGMTKK